MELFSTFHASRSSVVPENSSDQTSCHGGRTDEILTGVRAAVCVLAWALVRLMADTARTVSVANDIASPRTACLRDANGLGRIAASAGDVDVTDMIVCSISGLC